MKDNKKNVKKASNSKKKVSVLLNLPVELNDKYKELAESQGVPKTYLFITALNTYLKTEKSVDLMSQMVEIYNISKKQDESDNQDE